MLCGSSRVFGQPPVSLGVNGHDRAVRLQTDLPHAEYLPDLGGDIERGPQEEDVFAPLQRRPQAHFHRLPKLLVVRLPVVLEAPYHQGHLGRAGSHVELVDPRVDVAVVAWCADPGEHAFLVVCDPEGIARRAARRVRQVGRPDDEMRGGYGVAVAEEVGDGRWGLWERRRFACAKRTSQAGVAVFAWIQLRALNGNTRQSHGEHIFLATGQKQQQRQQRYPEHRHLARLRKAHLHELYHFILGNTGNATVVSESTWCRT